MPRHTVHCLCCVPRYISLCERAIPHVTRSFQVDACRHTWKRKSAIWFCSVNSINQQNSRQLALSATLPIEDKFEGPRLGRAPLQGHDSKITSPNPGVRPGPHVCTQSAPASPSGTCPSAPASGTLGTARRTSSCCPGGRQTASFPQKPAPGPAAGQQGLKGLWSRTSAF